jgi:Uma2 family endonuclease
MARMNAIPFPQEIEYPERDGKPMGETPLHREEMTYVLEALQKRFRDEDDVYVSGNMFFYDEEGRPERSIVPDVFVVRGVGRKERRTYQVWKEGGRTPCLVVEITSRDTGGEDLTTKKDRYLGLGVEEYFLFDPLEEYLRPPLQGFRRIDGRYRRVPPGPDGSLTSRTTGVVFRVEEGRLRLANAETGERYLRFDEEAAAREAAEARAEAAQARAEEEAAARRAAEERVRALEEELERFRREREALE